MQLHIPPADADQGQPLTLLVEHAANYQKAAERAITAIGGVRHMLHIIATKVAPEPINHKAKVANAFRPDHMNRRQQIIQTDDERHWSNYLLNAFAYPSIQNCIQALTAITIQTADHLGDHNQQAQQLFYSAAFLLVPPPPQDDPAYLTICSAILRTDYQRLPETKWRQLITHGFTAASNLASQHAGHHQKPTQPEICRDHLGRSIMRTPAYNALVLCRQFLNTAHLHSLTIYSIHVKAFEALEQEYLEAWRQDSVYQTTAI